MTTMKRNRIVIAGIALAFVTILTTAQAQKIDDERMLRDLKVAENVLTTLIRQKFEGDRMFFPLSVTGSYQAGYGVTFTLPADYTTPIIFSISADDAFLYGTSWGDREYRPRQPREVRVNSGDIRLKDDNDRTLDSLRDASNNKLVDAAKEFLADYGDIISQLPATEKIVITNQGSQPRLWVGSLVNAPGRSHLSIELSKADLNQFKQGRMTREQVLKKITVVNAQTVNDAEPDLELLSTIFNRLYRPDLSKTYFTEGNIYYERLKDFGAVFYMQVFSSNRTFNERFNMPTVGLQDVDQEERDRKVKEIYPQFEKELKENIVEYGRTVKSLSDEEQLIFNVRVTQCDACKIPSTLELSLKGSVLKDFHDGKITREAAMGKMTVKKGQDQ